MRYAVMFQIERDEWIYASGENPFNASSPVLTFTTHEAAKKDHEDVEMHLSHDGTVFFRQYDELLDDHHLIEISYQQLLDLWASMKQTEGLFKTKLLGG